MKKQKIKELNKFRKQIMDKILQDIESIDPSNRQKYNPVPILTVSVKLLHLYISVDNCVILNNPRLEKGSNQDLYYDKDPYFIGINVPTENYSMNNIDGGIDIRQIPRRKIALLCSKKQFVEATKTTKTNFVFINIPDFGSEVPMETRINDAFEKINQFDTDYVLIMFASNEMDTCLEDESKWNLEFSNEVRTALYPNIRATPNNNKHHETIGNYYGMGIISKYALQDNISIGPFARNTINNKRAANVIPMLSADLEYVMTRQQRAFPLSLYCAFIVVNSMLQVTREYPKECSKLIEIIEEAQKNINKVSVSNWICEEAETNLFHQECDSSYTLISVPFWDINCFKESNTLKGERNFIFKWTFSNKPNNDQKYLPLKMKDGITILFSGYGCYHRQNRTNNGVFWNMASYQNKPFYDKLRSSIIRLNSLYEGEKKK